MVFKWKKSGFISDNFDIKTYVPQTTLTGQDPLATAALLARQLGWGETELWDIWIWWLQRL